MLRVEHNKNSCYIFIANTRTQARSLVATRSLLYYSRSLHSSALVRIARCHKTRLVAVSLVSGFALLCCSSVGCACVCVCGVSRGECCKQTPKTALIWVIVLKLVRGQVFLSFSSCRWRLLHPSPTPWPNCCHSQLNYNSLLTRFGGGQHA